jgi:hypothetical protein
MKTSQFPLGRLFFCFAALILLHEGLLERVSAQDLKTSPSHTVYTIDTINGDDANPPGKPWKTFRPLQNLTLAAGDSVEIHPGTHTETLDLRGEGTVEDPIKIHFLPGVHLLQLDHPTTTPIFSSNSMHTEAPKPVGILFHHLKHARVVGEGSDKTLILYGKRVVQLYQVHAEDIQWSGISFDIKRPPMSEFRVIESHDNEATIQMAEGSDYKVENNRLRWVGDCGTTSWLSLDLKSGALKRCNAPDHWNEAVATDLSDMKVRLIFPEGTTALPANFQYINSWNGRDRLGVFNDRCKDLVFRDCRFHAFAGMGLLSQFTENLTYDHVQVGPPPGTMRTCAAIQDIIHCANCRGLIRVESCDLAGMQDDAMNFHGIYLGITGKPSEHQLELTFMHQETYGFPPCQPGDELELTKRQTLRGYPDVPLLNVKTVEQKNPKVWVVTLDGPAPEYKAGDVVDNVSWHPNLIIRNNYIHQDSVRGALITARGKVLVQGNTFENCAMPGILVAGDAHGYYESGAVRDLLITKNRFINCGIQVDPSGISSNLENPTHENIQVINNFFQNGDIGMDATRTIEVTGNHSPTGKINISLNPRTCSQVTETNNTGISIQ